MLLVLLLGQRQSKPAAIGRNSGIQHHSLFTPQNGSADLVGITLGQPHIGQLNCGSRMKKGKGITLGLSEFTPAADLSTQCQAK
jgi:hypothetical protein